MLVDIQFTHEPIVIPPEALPTREIGACLEFNGIVRETENGQLLQGLFYEAHELMARKKLEQHLAAVNETHPCAAVHFVHRLGWVPVGEVSLYIRILSAHRGEGLAFLAEIVDRLKQDVPIWKTLRTPDRQS